MKKWKKWLAVLLALLLLTSLFLPTHADFGDFSGDSDYGSSSDWDDDRDDDHRSSRSSYDVSSDLPTETTMRIVIGCCIVFAVFWIGIWIICLWLIKKASNSESTSSLQPIDTYAQRDPGFSETEMEAKLANLYVQCQQAWQAKDMTSLRPYFTDVCYERFDRQLDAYRQNGQTNRMERICVLEVELLGWATENGQDRIVARLSTRLVDYVVDDRTGSLVRGSRTNELFMTYEWTLVRPEGQETTENTGLTAQSCPHCGAPVSINHSARCEYCDSVLTSDTFHWVISDMKGLSQTTKRK